MKTKLFRINEILADKGINFRQLQKATGIRYETIKVLYDNTAKDCKLSTLIKLSEFLNVSIVDLFTADNTFDKERVYKIGYNQAIEDVMKLKK